MSPGKDQLIMSQWNGKLKAATMGKQSDSVSNKVAGYVANGLPVCVATRVFEALYSQL